jgi:hypothetical protein
MFFEVVILTYHNPFLYLEATGPQLASDLTIVVVIKPFSATLRILKSCEPTATNHPPKINSQTKVKTGPIAQG